MRWKRLSLGIGAGVGVVAVFALAVWQVPTLQRWSPLAGRSVTSVHGENPHARHDHAEYDRSEHEDHAEHDHAQHPTIPASDLQDAHGLHDHDPGETNWLQLSTEGEKNVGLELTPVELQPYERTMSVPAIVVERRGRSQVAVTAPLTGVVTRIYPLAGQTVEPGALLFEMRLTHEELVAAQADFLQSAEEMDVLDQELRRLESLAEGIIPGKTMLERRYERQKLEAVLRAQRQRLLLHGLSNEQVDAIRSERTLLRTLSVRAPTVDELQRDEEMQPGEQVVFSVQQLTVKQGQHVEAGATLCVLADHSELYIEGLAFEEDAEKLNQVAREDWKVAAATVVGDRKQRILTDLSLLYVADTIDPDSRALRFYVRLPNEKVRDWQSEAGRRYVQWRFKPGQRLELLVPVEQWQQKFVLPIDAVVQEGAEQYVFQHRGDHFDRVPVHVEYRDQYSVVVSTDGELSPGDVIATKGAYQIYLAMKNKSAPAGGGHHGHDH